MRVNQQIRGRFSAAIVLGLFWLVTDFLLRLGLLLYSAGQLAVGPGELIKVFAVGLVFDVAVAGQGLLPLVLYLAVVPRRFFNTRWNKAFILWCGAQSPGCCCSVLPKPIFGRNFKRGSIL